MVKKLTVWDLPLRLFHWSFVVVVCFCYWSGVSANASIELHAVFGVLALSLLAFRFCWGFLGTHHSRFKNFIPTPSRIYLYFKLSDEKRLNSHGHSPLAAISVFSMLLAISVQSVLGLFLSEEDSEFYAPLFNLFKGKYQEQFISWHVSWINVILVLIIIHLVAIIYYQLIKRKNIIFPMITGNSSSSEIHVDRFKIKVSLIKVLLAISISIIVYWSIDSGRLFYLLHFLILKF